MPLLSGGGGGGGSSPVALLGPYDQAFGDINTAAGAPIVLSPVLAVGSLVEPFAFFPTFFATGVPDNNFFLGVLTPGGTANTGESVQFDGNAPNDEGVSYGVSGLFDTVGRFPRRPVYRIKQAGCKLGLVGPSSGLTRGEIICWAFVWTP